MNKFLSAVVAGLGLGKKMGFPTANLVIPADFSLEHGVYAVSVKIDNKIFKGALHYGERSILKKNYPDDPGKWVSLEVYILDFDENIVGQNVEIEIIKKNRGVMEFESWEELKRQIEEDVLKVRLF